MPRYEYRCPACGRTQTEVHGMDESPEFFCQHPPNRMDLPRAERMERVISAPTFKVKGGTPKFHKRRK